jgi:hypothetical protein
MPAPSLQIQTVYAELLERAGASAFDEAFPEEGDFVRKLVKGRAYWYFQAATPEGRRQRYVGAETAELLERIARHRSARGDVRERRALVSAMVRSFGSLRPLPQIGEVVQALARAGVFRLRGVLVGTVAFQTYAPMLGVVLKGAMLQTEDVDIAQFTNVSVAVQDRTLPALDVLKGVDDSFRPIPHQVDGRKVTRYQAGNKLRVDFLTPNEGSDSEEPRALAALRTEAEPLRFLDFLIHDPEPAVVLHDAGVYVSVPAPQRFAIHKLIVSRRRSIASLKRDKDLRQAESLLEILAQRRPFELTEAWREAYDRGPAWRQILLEALTVASARPRDLMLKIAEEPRALLPKFDLRFDNPPVRYDIGRRIVAFEGKESFGGTVVCEISHEAIADNFVPSGCDPGAILAGFHQNRAAMEMMTREKYLSWPIEEPAAVLVKT